MEIKETYEDLLRPQYPVEYYGAKHKERLIDELTGRGNVYALIRTLHNQVQEFPAIYRNYLDTLPKIQEVLGPDSGHDIKKLMVAIDMQCGANMYWAGVEGLKMNYQHFINPYAPNCTWPNFEFDDFLQTDISSQMPLWQAAERFIESIRKQIPEDSSDLWDPVQEYCVSLELDGMKLAHYYGYLAGNELLRHWLPGYRSDVCLDLAYSHMLEKWYGCKLHTGEWEGFIRLADYVIAPIELSDPQDDCVLREQICKGK